MQNTLPLPGTTLQLLMFSEAQLTELLIKVVRQAINESKTEDLQEQTLTPKDVSKLLNISLPTVHKWSKHGILIKYKTGGRCFFKYNEVINSLKTPKKYARKQFITL